MLRRHAAIERVDIFYADYALRACHAASPFHAAAAAEDAAGVREQRVDENTIRACAAVPLCIEAAYAPAGARCYAEAACCAY